mmetsp:Transcript_53379/g.57978  ORF Transcript_53379/g.57978 Transcript_53379/m.57978 type:complete len:87 (-) Transcript_53379:60-320(-)
MNIFLLQRIMSYLTTTMTMTMKMAITYDRKEDLKNVHLFMKEVATQLCQQIQVKKWNVRKRRPLLSRDYSSDVSDVSDWCSTDAKC